MTRRPMLALAAVIAPLAWIGVAGAAPGASTPRASEGHAGAASPGLIDEGDPAATVVLSRVRLSANVNLQNREVTRYMNLEANVQIDPAADVIGVSYAAAVAEVLDERGRNLIDAEVAQQQMVAMQQRSFRPITNRGTAESERSIRIGVNVGNLKRIPARLQRVRGTAVVLVADKIVSADVAPVAPGRLIELNPGLRIQVTDALHENNRLIVTFDFEATQPNPFFNPNTLPPFVIAASLVDDQGNIAQQQGLQPNVKLIEDGVARGEAKITFPLPQDRKPARMQFEIVTKVTEQSIDFDARDIPLPGAEPKAKAEADRRGGAAAKAEEDARQAIEDAVRERPVPRPLPDVDD